MKSYKESHDLIERQTRVKEQRDKYPDMIPVIMEKRKGSKLAEIQKVKYLINSNVKFNQFKMTIKNKLNLDESKAALFVYCGQILINDDQTMQVIYDKHKDKEDGFLYLSYSDTEVFG